ncbi:MAG: cupin domain-containing protein [Betaproteobacteria bacterium]|nr:MAG: cupin domain-containing protein [Betaproteobacteria bacterium]
MTASINGDLTAHCAVDTSAMQWQASPSGTVWRKRVHLVGAAESGQVTSVVRYDSNSSFPEHGHPQGEEILVLDGVFSDQQGDWPAGTFLLNPEGFRHAPFSQSGCVLFVKLRQYPGLDRRHVAIDTKALEWQEGLVEGLARKPLYSQESYSDSVELQKWEAGSDAGEIAYPDGAEIFVIEGSFHNERGSYSKGHWLRLPAGSTQHLQTEAGCTVYLKKAGLKYLVSETESAKQ